MDARAIRGNRQATCERCGERLDACTCPAAHDLDMMSDALGRGSRWPSPTLGRLVFVAGQRAYLRRAGDRWAVEFEDLTLGTSWSRGVASEALREAEEYLRCLEGDGLRRGWR
jgi:hypothetical protein